MIVIQVSDFSGPFEVVRDSKNDESLQSFIDLWEKPTIYRLLGQTLGDLFIADLSSGVPQTDRFKSIFNAFLLPNHHESKGMKPLLLACISYQRDCKRQIKDSQSGYQQASTENSSIISSRGAMRFGESKFNEYVNTAKAIQYKCQCEGETYPEFLGDTDFFIVKYGSLI